MFEVVKNGERLTYVGTPTYINQHKDGFYILCDEEHAQGVVVDGTPYNLAGRNPIEGLETVALSPVDEGKLVFDSISQGNSHSELVVDHEYRLTLLELGVTE